MTEYKKAHRLMLPYEKNAVNEIIANNPDAFAVICGKSNTYQKSAVRDVHQDINIRYSRICDGCFEMIPNPDRATMPYYGYSVYSDIGDTDVTDTRTTGYVTVRCEFKKCKELLDRIKECKKRGKHYSGEIAQCEKRIHEILDVFATRCVLGTLRRIWMASANRRIIEIYNTLISDLAIMRNLPELEIERETLCTQVEELKTLEKDLTKAIKAAEKALEKLESRDEKARALADRKLALLKRDAVRAEKKKKSARISQIESMINGYAFGDGMDIYNYAYQEFLHAIENGYCENDLFVLYDNKGGYKIYTVVQSVCHSIRKYVGVHGSRLSENNEISLENLIPDNDDSVSWVDYIQNLLYHRDERINGLYGIDTVQDWNATQKILDSLELNDIQEEVLHLRLSGKSVSECAIEMRESQQLISYYLSMIQNSVTNLYPEKVRQFRGKRANRQAIEPDKAGKSHEKFSKAAWIRAREEEKANITVNIPDMSENPGNLDTNAAQKRKTYKLLPRTPELLTKYVKEKRLEKRLGMKKTDESATEADKKKWKKALQKMYFVNLLKISDNSVMLAFNNKL